MNGLDIAIVCILGFTIVRGIMTGLMQSISGFIGSIAGFYAAYFYYPKLADFLSKWLEPGNTLKIISFFIIFTIVLLVITIIGRIMKWLMKIAFLGWVDRLGGGVIGLLKGGILSAVLIIVLTTFLPQKDPLLKDSKMVPYISGLSKTMMQLIPEKMNKKGFDLKMDELNKIWKETEKKIKNELKKKK